MVKQLVETRRAVKEHGPRNIAKAYQYSTHKLFGPRRARTRRVA
jgi:hypothetical protein